MNDQREPIDWAHTQKAEHDRRIKAAALADAARRLGVRDRDLQPGKGTRQPVRLAAGLASVSEDTWIAVHELLQADEPPAEPAPPLVCCWGAPIPASSHRGEVHMYPGGPLCDAHAPWAVAGRGRPVPPPLPPQIAARRARPPGPPVHTPGKDEAIVTGKRRANPMAQRAARTAVAERRARDERARRRS